MSLFGWVRLFVTSCLEKKRLTIYVCAKGISILMRDVSCLGTSLPCNFTLTKLSLERNPFENDGALISTACSELGPPPLGDGGHPRGMDRRQAADCLPPRGIAAASPLFYAMRFDVSKFVA